jgi:hypothetical protein
VVGLRLGGPGETAPYENADRDAEAGQRRVNKPQVPARYLNLLGQPDPYSDAGRSEKRPPPAQHETYYETSADENEDGQNARVIGRPARWLEGPTCLRS